MSAKKNSRINKTRPRKASQSAGKNIALALTLIPLGAGLILIIAWALDWNLIGVTESQVWVGVFFLLISFMLSNLIQQRWMLFAGFLLLAIADLLFLLWVNIYAQIVAGVLAALGLGLIGFRYFQQISQQSGQQAK